MRTLWPMGVELYFPVEMAEWEGREAEGGEAWAGGNSCPLRVHGQQCPPVCQHRTHLDHASVLLGGLVVGAPLFSGQTSVRYRWWPQAPVLGQLAPGCLALVWGQAGHLLVPRREELSSSSLRPFLRQILRWEKEQGGPYYFCLY